MTESEGQFMSVERSIRPDDLAEVERTFGFTFPIEFRAHYVAINGGLPKRHHFENNGTVYVVQSILPIKYGRDGGLFEDVNRDLRIEEQILPEHLVAFADDPGGDFYCFSVRAQDAGSIWIYRGEYSDEPERAIQFLASSLRAFLAGLSEEKD